MLSYSAHYRILTLFQPWKQILSLIWRCSESTRCHTACMIALHITQADLLLNNLWNIHPMISYFQCTQLGYVFAVFQKNYRIPCINLGCRTLVIRILYCRGHFSILTFYYCPKTMIGILRMQQLLNFCKLFSRTE